MLREVVHAINALLSAGISWPTGERAAVVAADFQQICGLQGVMGAIDGSHFAISKPRFGTVDYFYFKSEGYTINCQAVVDSSKRFLDLHVGMPGSTNDSRILRRSTLFNRGQQRSLWNHDHAFDGFLPYLIGDGGYPLLPWLMVPHRRVPNLSLAQQLFNRRLSRGRFVVENAFDLLKLTFREPHQKSDSEVRFLPDVVTCCTLLHNLLLKKSHMDIERLLQVLRVEDVERLQPRLVDAGAHDYEIAVADNITDDSQQKRTDLTVFLSLQRPRPQ